MYATTPIHIFLSGYRWPSTGLKKKAINRPLSNRNFMFIGHSSLETRGTFWPKQLLFNIEHTNMMMWFLCHSLMFFTAVPFSTRFPSNTWTTLQQGINIPWKKKRWRCNNLFHVEFPLTFHSTPIKRREMTLKYEQLKKSDIIIIHAPKRGSIKFKVLIKILLHSFSLFPNRKQQAKRWPREQRPECKRFSKLFKLGSKLLCCFFFNILY